VVEEGFTVGRVLLALLNGVLGAFIGALAGGLLGGISGAIAHQVAVAREESLSAEEHRLPESHMGRELAEARAEADASKTAWQRTGEAVAGIKKRQRERIASIEDILARAAQSNRS
jgi:hypothetical protein